MDTEPRQELPAGLREMAFMLLLLLALPTACDRSGTAAVTPQEHVPVSEDSKEEGRAHTSRAKTAFVEGDFGGCEAAFVSAARFGAPTQRAQSLYGASRCAARQGRFKTSLFHLQGAASAGFGSYALVVTDPLLRPLYGHARWQLVLDVLVENSRRSKAERSPADAQVPFARSLVARRYRDNTWCDGGS